MKDIKTVTVIGATGVMGQSAAGLFASFGAAKVYCIARSPEKLNNCINKTVKLFRADSSVSRFVPCGFSLLEKCVSESDLVFESVSEDIKLKKEIHSEIASVMNSEAVYCTNTSGLSVTALSELYPEKSRKRFFGVHLFNPPGKMTLCEFIPTKYSDKNLCDDIKSYLNKKLGRTVVEINDTPAFLGNRICFQFLNEAFIFSQKYKKFGGIDYIDAILGTFTGIPSSPHLIADFVGLDVHKAIVDNLYENTNDAENKNFILPDFVNNLIKENKLGIKTDAGLYKKICNDDGNIQNLVYDIETGIYREINNYNFEFCEKMKNEIKDGGYSEALNVLINDNSLEANICLYFMLKYIVYSFYVIKELGYSFENIDDVCAEGLNRCPPTALFRFISSVTDIRKLIKERYPEINNKYNIDILFSGVTPSKYDYRKYFHSGR